MALVQILAACIGCLARHNARTTPLVAVAWHQSLRDRASAALKPGPQTWLVARAVSLKAF
jgi:hypothetical protein